MEINTWRMSNFTLQIHTVFQKSVVVTYGSYRESRLECIVLLNISLKFVFLSVILLTFYQYVKKGEVMICIFL